MRTAGSSFWLAFRSARRREWRYVTALSSLNADRDGPRRCSSHRIICMSACRSLLPRNRSNASSRSGGEMRDEIQAISVASSWAEYYDAHKRAYRALLESRWALGTVTFAQQLHHTAIPDAAGATAGVLNWAAYSQPSVETLHAFVPVFKTVLDAEPHRIRSNRYLFFVTNGE